MSAIRALESAAVLAFLMVQPAWAQPSAAAPGNDPGGIRSNCEAFAPRNASYSPAQAQTLISVRITAQGEMRDPTLFRSSGDDERDNAALACANGYQIGFVSVAGKPADVRWVLAQNWAARGMAFGPAYPPGAQNRPCKSSFKPEGPIPNPATTVSYQIATDGTVRDATVEESSGVPSFDSSVVRCVEAWRFFPVTQDGQPVEAGQKLQINWGKDAE